VGASLPGKDFTAAHATFLVPEPSTQNANIAQKYLCWRSSQQFAEVTCKKMGSNRVNRAFRLTFTDLLADHLSSNHQRATGSGAAFVTVIVHDSTS